MAIQSRVTQDRRVASRVMTLLNCRYSYAGASCDAVLVDLSLKGAMLSARLLPPKGGEITITLSTPLLKKPLVLEGRVIRGGWGLSDHGNLSRFGVQFTHGPLDLLELINKFVA